MKNSNFIKNSILTLLPLSLAAGLLFGANNTKREAKETTAHAISGLPQDIYLKDTSDNDIRAYYSSLNKLDANERKGTNLLKNLKPILSNGQKYFSYYNSSSKNKIWQAYEIVDRDWVKSPASTADCDEYDAENKVIIGYNYHTNKTSYSDPKNPYVHALYVDRNFDNPMKAWSLNTGTDSGDNPYGYYAHAQKWGGFNQEHIWPKSQGFDNKDNKDSNSGGAQGDLMHLWAGDGVTNRMHSDLNYGYVDMSKTVTYPEFEAGEYNYAIGNKKGTSKTLGSGTVFEPQDSDKGDIARAMFYLAARYNNYEGASSGFDANEPNLILANTTDTTTGTSSASNPFKQGILSDLLEWNRLDPPDEFEIHRNNLLYNNFTNNRNPFIDYPEWADIVWGGAVNYASPSSDNIHKFGSTPSVVSVSSIEVRTSPDKVVYNIGETFDSTGLVVSANYGNSSTILDNSELVFSPSGALSQSDKTITISYTENGITVTTTVDIGVRPSNEIRTKYIFNSKSWGTTIDSDEPEWVSSKDGNFVNDRGVQVTSGVSGAGATTKRSFSNVSKVIVKYSRNKNDGAGEIFVKVGENQKSIEVKKPATGVDGTVAINGTLTWENPVSGSVNVLVSCTSNSIYIESIDIIEVTDNPIVYNKVTGLSLNPNNLVLDINDTGDLAPIYTPANADIKFVTWESSDETVAVVNNGVVTGIGEGQATITARSLDDTDITATATVTVNGPYVFNKLILEGDYKTTFEVGDEFTTEGLTVLAKYTRLTDSRTEDVTEYAEFSEPDMTTAGEKTVNISCVVDDIERKTSYQITVVQPKEYSYSLCSSDIEEGYYLIAHSSENDLSKNNIDVSLLGNSIVSNRISYGTAKNNNRTIVNSTKAYVWHVYKDDDNYLIENPKSGVFASAGSASNKASLLDDANEKSYWTINNIDSSSRKEVINNYNSSNSINAYLRCNGTYGFATYSTSTGMNLYFYRLDDTSFVKAKDPQQIEAGDRVTFSAIYQNKEYIFDDYYSSVNYIKTNVINFENNGLYYTVLEQQTCFDVISYGGGFVFCGLNGYLKRSSTSTTLTYDASIEKASVFEFILNNGILMVRLKDTDRYIQFNYSSGNTRIGIYQQQSNYVPVTVYQTQKTGELKSWCQDFLSKTDGCVVTSWNECANLYKKLSPESIDALVSADANRYGNIVEQAVARYDYMMGDSRYNSNTKFIAKRVISNPVRNNWSIFNNKENDSYIFIAIISIIGLTSIAGYVFYKKRKFEN